MPGIESSASGDLSVSTLSRVVAWLAGNGATGCLVVEHGETTSRVYIRGGRPCGAVVMLGFKPLGLLLLEHGVIGIDALEASLNEVARSGRPQGAILVEQGHITTEVLAYWLWAQQRDRLHRLLASSEGLFRFDPSAELPEWTADLDLSPHLEVLRFLRSEAGLPHVDRLLSEFAGGPAILSPFDPAPVFKLDAGECSLIDCLARAAGLDEAVEKSALPPGQARGLLAALYCFHYVTPFDDSGGGLADYPGGAAMEALDALSPFEDPAASTQAALDPPPEITSWRAPHLGSDRVVRYASADDLVASIDIFVKQGALLVATDETFRAGEPFDVKLVPVGANRHVSLSCALSAVPEPGLALFRLLGGAPIEALVSGILDAAAGEPAGAEHPIEPRPTEEEKQPSSDAWDSTFEESWPPIPGPTRSRPAVMAPQPLPMSAALHPPGHPAELLQRVAEGGPCDGAGEISPLRLLAWLGYAKDDFLVEIDAPRGVSAIFEVLAGVEVHSGSEVSLLARPMTTPGARYRIRHLDEPSGRRQRASLQKLLVATTKAILRNFEEAPLEEGLGSRLSLCPRLSQRGRRVARKLSFSPAQERLVLHALDGTRRVDEILSAGIGRRAAWEILYLLEMRGGFEWTPPPELQIEDPVATRWQAVQGKDYFGVLGLHWSSHPDLVLKEYGRLANLYGPSGRLRESSPELAGKLWNRIEEAKRSLETKQGRIAHRKERYPGMSFTYQAELLVGQAKLALVRGDVDQTRILLESALDVAPVPAASEMLQALGKPIG